MADGFIVLPKSNVELRDGILRDFRLAAIDTGITTEPPVEPGSDYYIVAEGVSRSVLVGLAGLALADRERSVNTASDAGLEQLRIEYGIPQVAASGATGKIVPRILGSTTIVDQTPFVLPNGLHGEVVGTHVNPANGTEISVRMIDTGEETNLAGGEKVRFRSPPINVEVEAEVSKFAPLTGGTSSEDPERKRERIKQYLRTRPAGGNWAWMRQTALDTLGALQDCYVYPALGGPSSCKIVPIKAFTPSLNDFSRAPTLAALDTIRGALFGGLCLDNQNVIQAPADQAADFTIKVKIPNSSLAGGNGLGWTDVYPWPALVGGDAGTITIAAVANAETTITVDAQTTTPPIAGQTQIAWWSSVDRQFYTALVTASSGTSGAWVLTLSRPLRGKNGAAPLVGDYVCPAAQRLTNYRDAWLAMFETLGPGENTADASRLPRALRHPFVGDEDPSALTATAIASFARANPEISDYSMSYAPVTAPPVPASVDDPPNVLVPRHFGVYPL